MPLRRLNDAKRHDGSVPLGSMSKRVRLEELDQEIWAKVSIRGGQAKITIPYLSAVRANTLVAYEDRRFRVERVVPLGSSQQMRLDCTEAGALT